jgi:hypothetical protein
MGLSRRSGPCAGSCGPSPRWLAVLKTRRRLPTELGIRRSNQHFRHRSIHLGGANFGARSLVSPFRQPVVLTSHLKEVLFDRGRCCFRSQPSHTRRVLAIVIRRQRRRGWEETGPTQMSRMPTASGPLPSSTIQQRATSAPTLADFSHLFRHPPASTKMVFSLCANGRSTPEAQLRPLLAVSLITS